MYSQFRAQYPMGSLTADLVHLQPGHYVVRAMVQVGGVTLATGLSAAANVEQAEDLARARALAVLGIELSPYEAQAHWLEAPRELPQQPTAQLNPAEQVPMAAQPPAQVSEVDWALPESLSEPSQAFANGSAPAVNELSSPASSPAVAAPAAASGKQRRTSKQSQRQSTAARPSRQPSDQSFEAETQSMPVDLSDIIAQSDVELKRLGWSNLQGRRYLEQAYNKRSRQQLTDEELLEFLHYLQAQPLSEEPPF